MITSGCSKVASGQLVGHHNHLQWKNSVKLPGSHRFFRVTRRLLSCFYSSLTEPDKQVVLYIFFFYSFIRVHEFKYAAFMLTVQFLWLFTCLSPNPLIFPLINTSTQIQNVSMRFNFLSFFYCIHIFCSWIFMLASPNHPKTIACVFTKTPVQKFSELSRCCQTSTCG